MAYILNPSIYNDINRIYIDINRDPRELYVKLVTILNSNTTILQLLLQY